MASTPPQHVANFIKTEQIVMLPPNKVERAEPDSSTAGTEMDPVIMEPPDYAAAATLHVLAAGLFERYGERYRSMRDAEEIWDSLEDTPEQPQVPALPPPQSPALPSAMQPALPPAMQPALPPAMQPALPPSMQPVLPLAMQPALPPIMQPALSPAMQAALLPALAQAGSVWPAGYGIQLSRSPGSSTVDLTESDDEASVPFFPHASSVEELYDSSDIAGEVEVPFFMPPPQTEALRLVKARSPIPTEEKKKGKQRKRRN